MSRDDLMEKVAEAIYEEERRWNLVEWDPEFRWDRIASERKGEYYALAKAALSVIDGENEKLRETLRWYRDELNGSRARAALGEDVSDAL